MKTRNLKIKAARVGLTLAALSILAMPHRMNASEGPRLIEIKAKKFEFTPSEITLKKGEPVILRLSSEDRQHGFLLKPLNIDADIAPGKITDVAVTPVAAGDYTIICDHYCGLGHGNMKMTLSVR